ARGVETWQHGVSRRAGAVARDDHWDLFRRKAALAGLAAPRAGFSRQVRPFALERFQNERLIRLDQPGQGGRFVKVQRREETMPPAERGGGIHVTACRRLSERLAADQRLSLIMPPLRVM